jgi:hypothetical protein
VHNGVEQVQNGVGRLVQASIDRLGPVRRAREEMSSLRSRLEQLEASLAALDTEVMVGLAEPEAAEEPAAGTGAAVAPAAARRQASGNGSDSSSAAAASPAAPAVDAARQTTPEAGR